MIINANLIENLYNKATSAVYLLNKLVHPSRSQTKSYKGVYSHRLFSTSFWRKLCD